MINAKSYTQALEKLSSSDLEIRLQGITALAYSGRTEAAASLIETLKDPYPRLRERTLWALRQLDKVGAQEYLGVLPLLAHLMAYVREAALRCLDARCPEEDSLQRPAVLHAVRLLADQDLRVRYHAALFLRGLSHACLTGLLSASTQRAVVSEELPGLSDPVARIGAVLRLEEDPPADLPLLREAATDPHPGVRLACLAVLRRMEQRPFDLLAALLQDGDASVREMAIELADRQGELRAAPFFEDALCAPDGNVRWAATLALLGLESFPDTAVAKLAAGLKEFDPSVRYWTCWALGEIGPLAAGVLPALLELLEDAEARVRGQALRVISGLRPRSTALVLRLLQAWHDPEAINRWQAQGAVIWLLPQVEDRAAVETALVELTKDPDPEVRAAAEDVLRQK